MVGVKNKQSPSFDAGIKSDGKVTEDLGVSSAVRMNTEIPGALKRTTCEPIGCSYPRSLRANILMALSWIHG